MNDGNKKAPTLQRQGLGVNHLEAIHMADVKAVQNGAQQLVRVFDGLIGGVPAQICDGRELHAFLKNGKQFADWIKQRIGQYGFEENLDFVSFSPKSEKPQAGRRSIEYHLTLDMAKELSMVESNEQGRMARRYFIDMERRAHQQADQPLLPEQLERHLCYFRGARVEFLVGNGRVWGKAAHICNVLGVRSSDRLARSLSEGRKLRRKIGQQKHLYIDPEAVIKASDYCANRELASAWNDWAVKTVNGFGVGQPAMPLAVKDAENLSPAARFGISQLLDTRLLVTLDESGAVQVKPLARGALFVTAERLARLLEDPVAIPAEHLPGIMQAVAGRMSRVMQHSLSRS